MDIFVYFPPGMEIPRDLIEDELDEALEGRGEVTGGGGGVAGSNIDIWVRDGGDPDYLAAVRTVLARLDVPSGSVIEIEGKEFPVYPGPG